MKTTDINMLINIYMQSKRKSYILRNMTSVVLNVFTIKIKILLSDGVAKM